LDSKSEDFVDSVEVEAYPGDGYLNAKVNFHPAAPHMPSMLYANFYSISAQNRVRRVSAQVVDGDANARFPIPLTEECDRYFVEIYAKAGWSKRKIYRVCLRSKSYMFYLLCHFIIFCILIVLRDSELWMQWL
jgi:hypothetical protein